MAGYLSHVELDDAGLPPPGPEIEQERRVALFDLAEENRFAPCDPDTPPGPWRLRLSLDGRRLCFALRTEAEDPAGDFAISLAPFRQVVKDYGQICASYYDAVKRLPPAQIESFDKARRAIHEEGARLLEERLAGKADLDAATARRLFTLIAVLDARP